MKKSLLKRVMAAAVAVPVALTQTVLWSVGAAETAEAAADTATETITVDTFMNVPVDAEIKAAEDGTYVQESIWNSTLNTALGTIAGGSYDLDAAAMANAVEGDSWYVNALKGALANGGTAVVSVTTDKVVITADVDYDYAADANKALSEKFADLGATITAADVKGTVEITVNTVNLAGDKTVPFTVVCKDRTGAVVSAETMLAMVKDEYANLAAQALASAPDAAAAAEIADLIQKANDKIAKAEEKLEEIKTESKTISYTGADYNDVIAQVKADYAGNAVVDRVPATIGEAVQNSTVASAFAEALNQVGAIMADSVYTVDMDLAAVGAAAESVKEVTVDATIGVVSNATTAGQMDDDLTAEDEAVLYEYFNALEEANNNVVVEGSLVTYKVVEAEANGNMLTFEGDAYFNVKRVITYEVISKDDTTTTEETTTTVDPDQTTTVDPDQTTTVDPGQTTTVDPGQTTTVDPDQTTTVDPDQTTTVDPDQTTTTVDPDSTTTTVDPDETTTTENVAVEVTAVEVNFYFSHDEEAFDAAELIDSAILVTTGTDGENTWEVGTADADLSLISFGTNADGAVEGLTPAAVYEEVGEAYAPVELYVYYDGVLVEGTTVQVYIGVKGDVTLDGVADANDAAIILGYAANKGAGEEAYLYSADDEMLEKFAFFLGDTDTESKTYGADGEVADANDAANILVFAAERAVNPDEAVADTWKRVLLVPDTAA